MRTNSPSLLTCIPTPAMQAAMSSAEVGDDVYLVLPNEQYAKVKPIKNAEAWEATSKALPQQWQENVIIEME